MVLEPPNEDAMPLPSDLDPQAEQAVQRLLHAQPGLAIPAPVRTRVLAALADEAATRAALLGNDADLTPPADRLAKTSEQERQKLV